MEWLLKHVELALSDLSAVYHIEQLEEHKNVEDVGQVGSLRLALNVSLSSCIWASSVEVVWLSNSN